MLLKMVDNKLTDIIDSLFSSKESFNASSTYQFMLIIFADLVSQLVKFLLQFVFIQVHFYWYSLKL